ncbi:alpha-2,3-sialyltransferase [Campylobacter subantarcticus]|uniref:Alpha-2,3-sialyltransferase n=1 Tax=Campylobacter subantarcticus LMG 24374 TaxID=1388751 RepID=A0A0A8HB97_9BACT|nr:alpha-2,3-sialyltransferase [Campylobacter subantarcticus]AJC91252.1 alpha-2,3-sialyltransferase [Campylobacter subantarcticus LMG 24374]EAJ1261526.1 alpha-2,3-sialyltransferase [Campylobacter lari]
MQGGGNAIICGNGPSLKDIDYKKLPRKYDVFRCNQFYFEEKYYLGKNIKYAFFNPFVFFEQYYTTKKLIEKKEYNIENIICSTFNLPTVDNENFIKNFNNYFCDAYLGHEILHNIKDFLAFIKYNELYENNRITSGIYMCAIAIALGYKNIYLCGIDFYNDKNNMYGFDNKKENLLKLNPEFLKKDSVYTKHSKEFDLKALEFLKEIYGVNFYSLNNNELSKYIPLAPNTNNNFVLIDKDKNYVNDILIPKEKDYCKLFKQEDGKIKLKENVYYKLFKDLFRLPSDIKHYLKEKYANKNR